MPTITLSLPDLMGVLPQQARKEVLDLIAQKAALPTERGSFRVRVEITGEVTLWASVAPCSIQPWE